MRQPVLHVLKHQWRIVVLGLATPVMAIGAVLMRSGDPTPQEVATRPVGSRSAAPAGPRSTSSVLVFGQGDAPAAPDAPTSEVGSTVDTAAPTGSEPADQGSTTPRSTGTRSTGTRSTGTRSTGRQSTVTRSGASGSQSKGSSIAASGSAPGNPGGTGSPDPGSPSGATVLLADDFSAGDTGAWVVRSAGGGSVDFGGALHLAPAPAGASESNRAWVSSRDAVGDFDLSATITTTGQLRTDGPPADDETARVLVHSVDGGDGYVVVLGLSGCRLEQVSVGSPTVLDSGSTGMGLGESTQVRVRQVGGQIDVWLGSTHALSFHDSSPVSWGPVGFGSIDSTVTVDDVVVDGA